ncbi:MAG: Xaa-Pro peptidase family protein [Desulfurococcaceae archaeon]
MYEKIVEISERKNISSILITAPDNIEYFTGVDLVGGANAVLHYEKGKGFRIYVPLLEYYRFRDRVPSEIEVIALSKRVKPSDIVVAEKDWKDIFMEIGNSSEKIGVDISHASGFNRLIKEVFGEKTIDISEDIWRKRMIKDEKEIRALENAVKATLSGIRAIHLYLAENVKECELAGMFQYTVTKLGANRMCFDPIVAFKPNNTYPHTLPGNLVLGKRNLVLVDVGVKVRGRCSDVTRMIVWGKPSKEERKHLEVVEEALDQAVDSVQPGSRISEIHEAAVKVLERYGLGERFIHGLGHGVGVLVHEPPYIRPDDSNVLEPGMVITIEPGVYFKGKYGIRLEDMVLVTKKGARILSRKLERVLTPY